MSETENVDLGGLIADAAEEQDAVTAERIIRSGEFIVLQQIDMESGDAEVLEDGDISVVLAEWEDEAAVVCFSHSDWVQNFVDEINGEIPEGMELPAIIIDGNSLIDGLPDDCGLLVNPGSESESYFPPGTLEAGEEEEE